MNQPSPVDFSIKIPSPEELEKKKQIYLEQRESVKKTLEELRSLLDFEEMFNGELRRKFIDHVKLLTIAVDKLDRVAFEYFEAKTMLEDNSPTA